MTARSKKLIQVVVFSFIILLLVNSGVQAQEIPPTFLFEFTVQGQFSPYGIDIDRQGNIFVSDTINHRIYKFEPDGTLITHWGTPCLMSSLFGCIDPDGNQNTFEKGDGQFSRPGGIAIDEIDNVYVADSNNDRIQKFSPKTGRSCPSGSIEIDGSGYCFVKKFGTFCSLSGNLAGCNTILGDLGDGQFSTPIDIAIDKSGNIFVTDNNNNRIQRFNSNGDFQIKWGRLGGNGQSGQGNGDLHGPSGIAIDNFGDIIVVEVDNQRVQRFGPTGTFKGCRGPIENGFNSQSGSSFNTCIQNVAIITNRQLDGIYKFPVGIDFDPEGNFYVVDTNNHRIQKFDSQGEYILKWGKSQGSGQAGSLQGQFLAPNHIAINEAGTIYVTDTLNNRIQVFGTDSDGDGVLDSIDNCIETPNENQEDTVTPNEIGDACEDSDGDLIFDSEDNCPLDQNNDQKDLDGDNIGDICDIDIDNDDIINTEDNCPLIKNGVINPDTCEVVDEICDQADTNGDGVGDACQIDLDNDGIIDRVDNCRGVKNSNQKDSDNDGFGNACDNCPYNSNPGHQFFICQNAPTAQINFIFPGVGDTTTQFKFEGEGTPHPDGGSRIVAYEWESSVDGLLGTGAEINVTDLSPGGHKIIFKVQDSTTPDGIWGFTESLLNINLPPIKAQSQLIPRLASLNSLVQAYNLPEGYPNYQCIISDGISKNCKDIAIESTICQGIIGQISVLDFNFQTIGSKTLSIASIPTSSIKIGNLSIVDPVGFGINQSHSYGILNESDFSIGGYFISVVTNEALIPTLPEHGILYQLYRLKNCALLRVGSNIQLNSISGTTNTFVTSIPAPFDCLVGETCTYIGEIYMYKDGNVGVRASLVTTDMKYPPIEKSDSFSIP